MTLPVLPYGTPLVGQDASEWAVAILGALGAPVTVDNVFSLAGWFRREGGGGRNNPLNSTLGTQYPAINADGVRSYPYPDVGVSETRQTLQGGYPAIVASFRAGVGLGRPNAATAAELHEWSGGGYSMITPVPVPMPPAPKTYHYNWFAAGHQRNIVERYDKLRADPAKNRAKLTALRIQLKASARTTWILAHAGHPKKPNWGKNHYGWRYQGLSKRAGGHVVQPVEGSWPQS